MQSLSLPDRVILFDGVCNLCSGFVQWVIKHDPAGQFKFAALQSEIGQKIVEKVGLPTDQLNSVVLVEYGQAYTKSGAALRVLGQLPGRWRLLSGLRIIPRFIRNRGYDWIARHRYRWFGQQASCLMPTPELKARFL